jgi:hypothetical protein
MDASSKHKFCRFFEKLGGNFNEISLLHKKLSLFQENFCYFTKNFVTDILQKLALFHENFRYFTKTLVISRNFEKLITQLRYHPYHDLPVGG